MNTAVNAALAMNQLRGSSSRPSLTRLARSRNSWSDQSDGGRKPEDQRQRLERRLTVGQIRQEAGADGDVRVRERGDRHVVQHHLGQPRGR